MQKLAPVAPPLTAPATTRWKSSSLGARKQSPTLAYQRKFRRMITDQDTSVFLDTSLRAPFTMKNRTSRQENERHEITSHLSVLKKKFNTTVIAWERQEKKLHELQQEATQINFMENVKLAKHKTVEDRVADVMNKIEETKKAQEEALFNQSVYNHMLERMKQTMIHLDIQKNNLKQSMKIKNFVLQNESIKAIRSKENAMKTKLALKTLNEVVGVETKDKKSEIGAMERDVQHRIMAAQRREERQKRQAEIAEVAANEDRDKRLTEMKEKMLLHRLWYQYIDDKLEKERTESKIIEVAFERIRKVTGLQNIQEVVERFLTKEQTYNDLLLTIKNAETRLENLKADIHDIEDKIQGVEIAGSEDKTGPIVKVLEKDALEVMKEYNAVKARHAKVTIVYKRVTDWVRRMLKKIQAINQEDLTLLSEACESVTSPGNSAEHFKPKVALEPILYELANELRTMMEPYKEDSHSLRKNIESKTKKKLDQIIDELPEEFKIHNKRFNDYLEEDEDAYDEALEGKVYSDEPRLEEKKSINKKSFDIKQRRRTLK